MVLGTVNIMISKHWQKQNSFTGTDTEDLSELLLDLLQCPSDSVNAQLVEECVKVVAHNYNVKIVTECDRKVRLLSALPPLINTTRERTDVVVYNEDKTKLLTLIEVHSSPIKCILSIRLSSVPWMPSVFCETAV